MIHSRIKLSTELSTSGLAWPTSVLSLASGSRELHIPRALGPAVSRGPGGSARLAKVSPNRVNELRGCRVRCPSIGMAAAVNSETQGGRYASEADLSPPQAPTAVPAGRPGRRPHLHDRLPDLLKQEWGLIGAMVTDWDIAGRLGSGRDVEPSPGVDPRLYSRTSTRARCLLADDAWIHAARPAIRWPPPDTKPW